MHGKFYWNIDAKESGVRIGWKLLIAVGKEIQPATTYYLEGKIVRCQKTPLTLILEPVDLQHKNLVTYVNSCISYG